MDEQHEEIDAGDVDWIATAEALQAEVTRLRTFIRGLQRWEIRTDGPEPGKGRLIAGPFTSRDAALAARSLIERLEGDHGRYWCVDVTSGWVAPISGGTEQ